MAAGSSEIRNKIVLEGEAQYKKAMADINRTLKENKSELKAASLEYANAGESMVAMYGYGDALERTLETQTQALEAMHAQLEKVESAYGENSREAVELRTKINNRRAETAKTTAELNNFRDRLDATGDAGQEMGQDVAGAAESLARVGDAAEEARGDVDGLNRSLADAMGEKLIELGIAKEALKKIGDAIKEIVVWGLNEGAENIAAQHQTQARTNTTEDEAAMLVRVQDAVKRQFAAYVSNEQAGSLVDALWTGMKIQGHVPTEEELTELAPQVQGISLAKGVNTTTLIGSAQTLVTEFGETWQHSFDMLDELGAATVGHTQEAISAMGTYSEVFKQAGYDADDMFGIMIAGAQEFGVDKLGDIGKNLQTFEKNLTSGSKSTQEALQALGIEATDLPAKFQEGGETAKAAMGLVLQSLLSVEDTAKRNDIAKALFGDANWIKNGEDIARLFLQGYDNAMDVEGRAAQTAQLYGDTLENNWAGLGERAAQQVGDFTQPVVEAANEAVKEANRSIDAAGGDVIAGTIDAFGRANEQMGRTAAQGFDNWARNTAIAVDGAFVGFGSWLKGGLSDVSGWFSGLLGDTGAELSEAAGNLDSEIASALASGDAATAAQLQATGEAIYGSYDDIVTRMIAQGASLEEAQAAVTAAMADGFSGAVALIGASGDELIAAEEANTGRWIDSLTERGEAAASASQKSIETLREQEAALQAEASETYSALMASSASGMMDGTTTELAQRYAQLVTQLASIREQIAAEMETAGQEGADAFSAKGEEWNAAAEGNAGEAISGVDDAQTDMETAGEDLGAAGVEGLESTEGDMATAGKGVGDSGVDGLSSGLSGMEGAGADGASGAVSGLRTGISGAYSAGYEMGKSYERGYKAALDQHSPSRVMYAAAGDTTEGLLDRYAKDRDRVRQAAAALGDAVSDGYADTAAFRGPQMAAGGGIDAEMLGEVVASAVAQAVSGIAFMIDGRVAGYALEPYSSRATSERAGRTIRGQSASVRSW